MPFCLQISATAMPDSPCRKILTIWLSVNRAFFNFLSCVALRYAGNSIVSFVRCQGKLTQALDLSHVTALAVPSRHKALTAVLITPGHDGAPQPDGWTCVMLSDAMPGGGHTAATAWHNPTLADLYRSYVKSRSKLTL